MTRPVNVNVTDRLLRLDYKGGSIYVHRDLLCARSKAMKRDVEEIEEEVDSGLSSIDTDSWAETTLDKPHWELYIGYLYGHPLWTRNTKHIIEKEFERLVMLWDDLQVAGHDPDASDAAMDAMRELITQHAGALGRPFNILGDLDLLNGGYAPRDLLMDFMVFGQSASLCGKWYEAYVSDKDQGSIDKGLAGRFSKKAQAKAEGNGMPDLMERCRYHVHKHDLDPRCYLDK